MADEFPPRLPQVRPDHRDALTDVLHRCGFTWSAAAQISRILRDTGDRRLDPDTVAGNILDQFEAERQKAWLEGCNMACDVVYCPRLQSKEGGSEDASRPAD